MVYTVQFNEEQRKLLDRGLNALSMFATRLTDEQRNEISLLRGMLDEMPVEEVLEPGTTHCFHL